MPKLKTHKGTQKRLKITGAKKLMRRSAGQDHFNSREVGKVTRNKRRDTSVSHADKRATKRLIPHG